jgi:hypothetical protein
VYVTEAGRRVQEFAQRAIEGLESAWNELHKARRDRALRFAAAGFGAYVGEFLAETHDATAREFEHRGLAYIREVVPVTSTKVDRVLLERADLDFAFAGALCDRGEQPSFDQALEFTEWTRDEFVVLSNIDTGPGPLSSRTILERQIPMVAPHRGAIFDLLVAELDDAERGQLNIAEWCDEGLIAIDLLRHNLRHAALLCTRTFARFAKSRGGSDHLLVTPLQCHLTHRFGLVARKADLAAWSLDHPGRLLWEHIARLARSRAKQQTAAGASRGRATRVAAR